MLCKYGSISIIGTHLFIFVPSFLLACSVSWRKKSCVVGAPPGPQGSQACPRVSRMRESDSEVLRKLADWWMHKIGARERTGPGARR